MPCLTPHDTQAPMHYLSAHAQGAAVSMLTGEVIGDNRNPFRSRLEWITDCRPATQRPQLHTQGWTWTPIEPMRLDDVDLPHRSSVEAVENVVLRLTGGQRVQVFDAAVRRVQTVDSSPGVGRDSRMSTPQSVQLAHCDYTPDSGRACIQRNTTWDMHCGRVWIVNVWVPLNAAVTNPPLAIGIPGHGQLFTGPCQLVYTDRTGSMNLVKDSSSLKWCYVKGLNVDEALVFKTYDSAPLVDEWVSTPHSAFWNSADTLEPLRQSIEFRCAVQWIDG
ncbi:MAG TPA: CmcJ/NvfI family oxidoreductase [Limnobacter sp.]|uniref:CmcJ/NvfI family oxidoreductase n=1 Tax=Limnobacter sp. TaxID=2003368 RepID=UPI002ED9F81B